MARLRDLLPTQRVDYSKEMGVILVNDLKNNYQDLKIGWGGSG